MYPKFKACAYSAFINLIMENITKILEVIAKIPTRFTIALTLAFGILLFANKNFLSEFDANNLLLNLRPFSFIGFLFSLLISLVNLINISSTFIRKKIEGYKKKQMSLHRLKNMSKEEKEIFLGYVNNDTRTQYFCGADGVIKGLEIERFVTQSSYLTTFTRIAYNIQPWVWDEFKKNFDQYFSSEDVENFKLEEISQEDKSFMRGNPLAKYF